MDVEAANMDIQPLRERLRQWAVDRQQKAAGQQQKANWARFRSILLLVALVGFFLALVAIRAYRSSGR